MKTRKRGRMRVMRACKTKRSPLVGLLFAHFAAALIAAATIDRVRDMQQVEYDCSPHQTEAVISITFDDYPAELSWKIADTLSGSVVCSRDFANKGLIGGQIVVDGCCLDHRYWKETPEHKNEDGESGDHDSMDDRQLQLSGREYTFTILDSYGDGMCCSHGRGSYTVAVGGEIVVDGRSSSAAAFGASASTSFIAWGETPTPTQAPWWTPYPTDEPTVYPTGPTKLYDCPPTSVMGSKGFSSEFNGCITSSGCRFLATPDWDNGSFNEEACWYCCSSEDDGCGICSGCDCGYALSDTPAPTVISSMDVDSEMPTHGYPPLDNNLSPEKAARVIWADASRGTYPWHPEQDCIEHPTNLGGRDEQYAAVVSAMIRALRDHRLDWDIADAMMFNISAHIPIAQCEPLVSTARVILDFEGEPKLPAFLQLQPELRRAVRAFVTRAEEEDSKNYRSRPKVIVGVLIFIAMLVVGGIFVCTVSLCCTFLRRDKNSDDNSQDSAGGGAAAGGVAVAGSLVTSATILPSIAEVPPIPVASAVPISGTGDEGSGTAAPVAKVVGMNYEDGAVPIPSAQPIPSAPPAEPIDAPAAGASLAARMTEAGSFGRTEAITEWMRDNPSLAASLSPDDMVLALSAVSFSLDQPLAAKEIAAGVAKAGGKVTCDHVVKVLGVCDSSARLEVAKSMAPFVSDLANEETILSLFESSYEREQVDRALNG